MDDEQDEFEIEHGHEEYAVAELLEQAQANAQATVIATVAFLRERGIPLEEWTDVIGRRFARGWDEPRPWDAGEFMDAMLTNLRSLGATVVSADLETDRAEAVTAGFPNPDLCVQVGVEVALAARFNDAAGVIARDRGLSWAWHLEGANTRFVAARVDG